MNPWQTTKYTLAHCPTPHLKMHELHDWKYNPPQRCVWAIQLTRKTQLKRRFPSKHKTKNASTSKNECPTDQSSQGGNEKKTKRSYSLNWIFCFENKSSKARLHLLQIFRHQTLKVFLQNYTFLWFFDYLPLVPALTEKCYLLLKDDLFWKKPFASFSSEDYVWFLTGWKYCHFLNTANKQHAQVLFFWFEGYAWWCLGIGPGSVLRGHSLQQCLRDCMWCQVTQRRLASSFKASAQSAVQSLWPQNNVPFSLLFKPYPLLHNSFYQFN